MITAIIDASTRRAPLPSTREAAARHEAGHAVAADALGRRLRSVRVRLVAGEWAGEAELHPGHGFAPPAVATGYDDTGWACFLLAGAAAELLDCAAPGPVLPGALPELAEVVALVHRVAWQTGQKPAELEANLWQRTVALLNKRRGILDAVAAALCERRKLSGKVLRRLLNGRAAVCGL